MIGGLPISVMTDSYKAGHFAQYPDALKMVAYGEFRKPYKGLEEDERFVFYGIRYFIETYLYKQWTVQDVEQADIFYKTHNAGNTPYPYPKDLFLKFVKENDGYFPVRLEAIQEGSVLFPHIPVYVITAEKEYSRLCTFLETLLTMVWYPTTVATLSRKSKQIIADYFEKTVEEDAYWKLPSRLHDFGFRGCTGLEQSILGGCAHLLNFEGSDTMSACFYAQFTLNGGKPVASSIPATEHSVMTSWKNETEAIENMIENFGKGVFACVMDSYDYSNALYNILPVIKEKKTKQGGFMVVRPDSGDPVESVLMGLDACAKVFGTVKNKKGYLVIQGASVIQGDGINVHTIVDILKAATDKGYSAECMGFGMGGGLLQKVDRDTMSFATKLCYIQYADGKERDVMKMPLTDLTKFSLPGILKVNRNKEGIPMVYVGTEKDVGAEDNMLKLVYDLKPVGYKFECFDDLKKRVETEWKSLPLKYNVIGDCLQKKIDNRKEESKKMKEELDKAK
jgi:nicotinic acid phosphoribosyltransferase